MSIIYKVKEELNKLQISLSEQIKGYETQPVETSDEQITQGWLEAILYVDKYLQRLEESKESEQWILTIK